VPSSSSSTICSIVARTRSRITRSIVSGPNSRPSSASRFLLSLPMASSSGTHSPAGTVGQLRRMMTPSFHFSTTRPTLPAQTTIVFVNDYWAHWSESNEDALAYLAKIYADEVDFYGKQVSRHKLMDEKRRFAER
jgi:hypothetical protein